MTGAVAMIMLFTSCKKTAEGLGIDAINNVAKSHKWEVVHQIFLANASEPITSDSLTRESAYAKFQSDDKVHYYNNQGTDNPNIATPYGFSSTKSVVYDGVQFSIQENLVGSFSRMTWQRKTDAGREVYIFTKK